MHNKFLYLAILITSISVFSCTGENVDKLPPADGMEIINDASIVTQKFINLNLGGQNFSLQKMYPHLKKVFLLFLRTEKSF